MIDPTTASIGFWDAFSPYMEFMENVLGINLDNLAPVLPLMRSPVLVVGAGQGLLVEELRKRGFRTEGIDLSPHMVANAEKRRGIKLYLANANSMPFENGQFQTSIIATGVIDFLNDSGQIEAILKEVRRVTDASGEIFVALFGMTPQAEELLQYIGILSEGRLNIKMMATILLGSQSPPREVLRLIRQDPNKSTLQLFVLGISGFLSMRKRARMRIKANLALKKKMRTGEIQKPGILLEIVPECLFIRDGDQIHELFAGLSFPPRDVHVFDNCKIVRL